MSPSLKRNGYCWGMVGVNGAKTRAHVVSLGLVFLESQGNRYFESKFRICRSYISSIRVVSYMAF